MYRDENNFKFFGSAMISHDIDLHDLKNYLFCSETFIPEKVGLPSLVPLERSIYDHDLHEILEIIPGFECENPIYTPDLIERFRHASSKEWFYA
jgi:hypothetical protein